MPETTQVRMLKVRDLSAKGVKEKAEEEIKNRRLRQLSALRVYHQAEIKKIDDELATLLKDEVVNITY